MSDTVALLQAALQALTPEHLEIQDYSAAHAGSTGGRAGGALGCDGDMALIVAPGGRECLCRLGA